MLSSIRSSSKCLFSYSQNVFRRKFASSESPQNQHPLFSHTLLRDNVWMIEEKYFISWNRANIFFIKGSDADLLVDTGVGIYDLPTYLDWSGLRKSSENEKPLLVALTHSHFDHSGGAYQFEKLARRIYIHKSEARFIRHGSPLMTVSWITPQEVVPKPVKNITEKPWRAEDYEVRRVESLTELNENDSINLGDKTFKVIHLPGHSPGSIGLHDVDNGVIITGDTVHQTDAELIDWYPGSSVKKMWHDVERIATLAENKQIDLALPGHNAPLDRETLLKAADRHLKGSRLRKRTLQKIWPRMKTTAVFAAHGYLPNMPDALRDWTFN